MTSQSHRDKIQDQASEDSFPASDPPATSGITGPGRSTGRDRSHDTIPTGHPTSDRHGTETAHQWEPDEKGIDAARDLTTESSEAENEKP